MICGKFLHEKLCALRVAVVEIVRLPIGGGSNRICEMASLVDNVFVVGVYSIMSGYEKDLMSLRREVYRRQFGPAGNKDQNSKEYLCKVDPLLSLTSRF